MATATLSKPKTTKAKPTQIMAVSEIMLTAKGPLTLKEIAKKATKLTGKPASESAVSARLRDLRKPNMGNLKVLRTAGPTKGVFLYEVQVKTIAQALGLAGVPSTPANPITFGRPASNVGDKVGFEKPAPVAGSRSATAFADSLKRSDNQPNG